MNDLISRRAAIDALCAVCGKACDKSKFVYNAPQDEQVILCPEHYCLCTLPSAQPVQWIPCSERLPEEGQGCLVCDKGSILIDTFIGHGNPYNWKWYIRDYEAWMPLPEPYREERREE